MKTNSRQRKFIIVGLIAGVVVPWIAPAFVQAQDRKKASGGHNLPSGRWKQEYDYKVDGEVHLEEGATAHMQLEIRGNQVTGKYDEPRLADSRQVYTGEFIHGRDGTLLILRQSGEGRPAVYVGRLVGNRRFVGTYLEAKPDGLAGDFILTFAGK